MKAVKLFLIVIFMSGGVFSFACDNPNQLKGSITDHTPSKYLNLDLNGLPQPAPPAETGSSTR